MSSTETVWYVKLPADWKDVFEKMAEADGDVDHGKGARKVRKVLRKFKESNA